MTQPSNSYSPCLTTLRPLSGKSSGCNARLYRTTWYDWRLLDLAGRLMILPCGLNVSGLGLAHVHPIGRSPRGRLAPLCCGLRTRGHYRVGCLPGTRESDTGREGDLFAF